MKPIPYARQEIDDYDIASVIETLKSDFLTQGPQPVLFEKNISEYCGANFGVSFNSATSALHAACLALSIGENDYVWTSPNTFVASSNCALYCGAKVDFVDIDQATYNISIEKLEEKLSSAKKENKLPKVVIAVHFAGQSCDMEAIFLLSQKYGFKLIEDASHAIGGKYKEKRIGNCSFSDITIFSFHPVKIITTGEGGMAVTNQKFLADHMIKIRSHGIAYEINNNVDQSKDEIWNYHQISLGFNYRMTDIQAALGVSQFRKIDEFLLKRHSIAKKYDNELKGLPVTIPFQDLDCYSSFHLYVVRLKLNEIKKSQKEIYNSLKHMGINVNLHYIPVYLHPYYQSLGFKRGLCPESELYFKEAISLPMFSGLSTKKQDYVIESIKSIIT